MRFITSMILVFLMTNILQAQELRPIKTPVEYPESSLGFWIVMFVLMGVVLMGVFIFWKWQGFKKTPVIQKTPWEIATQQLSALHGRQYLKQGLFKEYYSELSDIIRHYFEGQFDIRAGEMTTEEFLQSLQSSHHLSAKHREMLEKFLEASDLVKFAKVSPGIVEAEQSYDWVKQLVEQTRRGT